MKLIVNEENGLRLDKFLAINSEFSRELVTKMIDEKKVFVNGKNQKCGYKLKNNDIIEYDETYKVEQDIIPEKMDIDIIYEDEYLMIINKPSGMVVHPGSGNFTGTLVNGLMHYTKNLSDINGENRVGIVHRIDKDTSGIMMVAKTNQAHEKLAEMFKTHDIKREYIALLCGVVPYENATIDAPIKRDSNVFNMMCVHKDGKSAVTHLHVLKRYKDYSLVSLKLETGRTHQIRVHMKYIGYPIHNDPVYGNKNADDFGQFLHSKSIDFVHPITGENMHFECDLPKEFQDYLNIIQEDK